MDAAPLEFKAIKTLASNLRQRLIERFPSKTIPILNTPDERIVDSFCICIHCDRVHASRELIDAAIRLSDGEPERFLVLVQGNCDGW